MPNESSTGTTSQPDPASADAGTGSGANGGASGTDSSAEQFAKELEALKAEARKNQGEADRARAEVAKLKAQLDARPDPSVEGTPAPTPSNVSVEEQVRRAMRLEAARSRELLTAAETARNEYPNALASVTRDLDQYDSAEELMEAARQSHDSLTAHIDERTAAAEKALRERYEQVHGPLPEPSGGSTGDAPVPTGDPTIEQLNAMTTDQLDRLEEEKPGIIEKVLRSADQLNT